MRRAALILAATAVAALGAAGSANAAIIKFGSKLAAPANRSEAHGADSVFWNIKLPNNGRVRAPAKGQVKFIKLKGTAVKQGGVAPRTLFHIQVLHPLGDGRVQVSTTSGGFNVPVGGDPNQISTYKPINLCAKKGDFVAFNDVGGYNPPAYPQGTPFRIFSTVAGSTTNFFTKSNGTNTGAIFTGAPHQGEQLLMRVIYGTGTDANAYCRNR